MMKGLKEVSHLLKLYKIREGLYLEKVPGNDKGTNLDFENAVIELYIQILEYQAYLLCYLSKRSVQRGLRNA